jgi:hypothetical protein
LACDSGAGEYCFEDFYSKFGYNVDSIKDHNVWEKCVRTRIEFSRFIGNHYEDIIKAFY